jgi:hypothetical protein
MKIRALIPSRLALMAAAALLPLPALAADADLAAISHDLALKAESGGYAAAIAACILGKGDPKATERLFTTGGWAASRDDEMGEIDLTSPANDLTAMIATDGGFCQVSSEAIGTGPVMDAVTAVLAATSDSATTVKDVIGCTAFVPMKGLQVGVSSSGNDPTCQSDTTSAVRVEFK